MPFYFFEYKNHDRDKNKNDPGSVEEFADADNNNNNAGCDCTYAVNDSTHTPIGTLDFVPVNYHAYLSYGEGEKNTDGIKRNKIFGFALIDIN